MPNFEPCKAEHNPGVWPYVSRCVRPVGHVLEGGDWAVRDVPADPASVRAALSDEHVGRNGEVWLACAKGVTWYPEDECIDAACYLNEDHKPEGAHEDAFMGEWEE